MAFPNPYDHEVLSKLREERLRRAAARHGAFPAAEPKTGGLRKVVAAVLKPASDRPGATERGPATDGVTDRVRVQAEGRPAARRNGW